jgi:putative membrane protein
LSEAALHLLTTWNWDPSIVMGTVLFIAAYFGALGPFHAHFQSHEHSNPAQIVRFLLGVGVILFALVSPLDAIGDEYLFTAHMLQHTLLMVVAPPLLLSGLPGWMLRPLLLHPTVKPLVRVLTLAPVAFLLFNLDLLLWHLPALYEATLENESLHIVEHLSFIGLGVLNWWPTLSPLPDFPRLPYPGQILYLVLNLIPSLVLGWFFVSASTVAYPTYATAPHVFGIYGLDDQLIGGYMMSMPSAAIYLGAVWLILGRWLKQLEHARPQLGA